MGVAKAAPITNHLQNKEMTTDKSEEKFSLASLPLPVILAVQFFGLILIYGIIVAVFQPKQVTTPSVETPKVVEQPKTVSKPKPKAEITAECREDWAYLESKGWKEYMDPLTPQSCVDWLESKKENSGRAEEIERWNGKNHVEDLKAECQRTNCPYQYDSWRYE